MSLLDVSFFIGKKIIGRASKTSGRLWLYPLEDRNRGVL